MEKSVGLFKSTQSATWQKEKEGKANEQESLQKKKKKESFPAVKDAV